jgi:hypothetical protein
LNSGGGHWHHDGGDRSGILMVRLPDGLVLALRLAQPEGPHPDIKLDTHAIASQLEVGAPLRA